MTSIEHVAILSPGDMGAGIGGVLRKSGLDVLTCLDGRSNLTRLRALESDIREVGFMDDVVKEADIILSVLPPGDAVPIAERVARSLGRVRTGVTYVDCNAISPQTSKRIEAVITGAGASYIDAGIIGGPPSGPDSGTRFFCSGPDTSAFEALGGHGLDVRVVGPDIGQASGLKMVYAASTKGTTALWTELLAAARALGLDDALGRELESSRIAAQVMRAIPSMPRRSRRWVAEMEEIAATFAEVGLTPNILQGAADMYRLIGETPLGRLTSRDENPALDEILDAIIKQASSPSSRTDRNRRE
jgi:3-hydroxyisobutyrate dehydrogenase-like beta-hydroxyacid dehydrogenase